MDDAALTKLLCGWLGDIDGWAYDPDPSAVYADTAVAVFYGRIAESPDRAVGVRVYQTDDDPETDLSARRVQLRHRGTPYRPDVADELAGESFARLQGLSRVGGISGIRRLSMAPLGADKNGREERTDNYIITLDNLEA